MSDTFKGREKCVRLGFIQPFVPGSAVSSGGGVGCPESWSPGQLWLWGTNGAGGVTAIPVAFFSLITAAQTK